MDVVESKFSNKHGQHESRSVTPLLSLLITLGFRFVLLKLFCLLCNCCFEVFEISALFALSIEACVVLFSSDKFAIEVNVAPRIFSVVECSLKSLNTKKQ